jgi:hypothetical protein
MKAPRTWRWITPRNSCLVSASLEDSLAERACPPGKARMSLVCRATAERCRAVAPAPPGRGHCMRSGGAVGESGFCSAGSAGASAGSALPASAGQPGGGSSSAGLAAGSAGGTAVVAGAAAGDRRGLDSHASSSPSARKIDNCATFMSTHSKQGACPEPGERGLLPSFWSTSRQALELARKLVQRSW